jgi:hypothetical protein
MKDDMADTSTVREGAAGDIEAECQTWDWARTAGVSAEDLREALKSSMHGELDRRLAKAA